jgi:hypothetical protein
MAGEKDPFGTGNTPDAPGKIKKPWQLNVLILAGVFLLGALLPLEYKAYAPLLFVVPFIVNIAKKIRQDSEDSANPPRDSNYSPPMADHVSSPEPYSYRPKNPKDPRKYKPIG